jgi:hypothetical protein
MSLPNSVSEELFPHNDRKIDGRKIACNQPLSSVTSESIFHPFSICGFVVNFVNGYIWFSLAIVKMGDDIANRNRRYYSRDKHLCGHTDNPG